MAIESLPVANHVWQPDSRHLDHIPSLRQATGSEDKRAKPPPFEEPTPQFRDSSISRASICSLGGAELNSLPVSPCFQHVWSERVAVAVSSWQTCEIPVPSAFWHSGSRDHVGESPLLEKWEQQALGRSPLLLSLFATLPRTSATCRHVSEQLHSLSLWGSWMQGFGTREEYSKLGAYFRSLQTANPLSRQQQIETEFPRRLAMKYPGRAENFQRSMRLLFPQQSSTSKAPWSSEYLTLCALYAEEGLTLHHRIRAMCEAKQTADPSMFLVCRALTSGFPALALLASKNTMAGGHPEAEALNAVYPLLALGSMLAATFSDLFLASRQLADKSGSVSSLQMFDDEWACVVHNSLLVLFHEEADTLVDRSSPRSSHASTPSTSLAWRTPAVRSQVVCLVNAIKAALHGLVVWYQTVPAFRAHPDSLVAVDLTFSFASSPGHDSPQASTSTPALGPDAKPLSAQEESDPLPPWVTDAVDSAVARLVQLLRGSASLPVASPRQRGY